VKDSESGTRAREDANSFRHEAAARVLNTAKEKDVDFVNAPIPWRERSTNTALDARGRDSEVQANAMRGFFSDGDIG
jgi:hypothetical protein